MQDIRSSKELYDELKKKQVAREGSHLGGDAAFPIDRLMLAVLQSQDVYKATKALNQVGISATRLSSTGAFLGRRNTTLMIGLAKEQEDLAISIIHENCRQRVEYVSTPLEGAPMPIPIATPVTVGGATVFSFNVERYEEI